MGLFSFLRKSKQETPSGEGEFYSRAEEESQLARGRKRKSGKSAKEANSPVDPVLPEKKRARRRLVGAVALVLAMIIGLPMILDSEPKPVSEDIAIQIPSKDKPGAALPAAVPATVPATAPSPNAASAPAASVSAAASLGQQEQLVQMPKPNTGAATPPAATPVKMPAQTASPPATAAPAAPAAAASVKVKPQEPAHEADEAKPAVKVEHAAESKPQAKPEHDDARAAAILDGKDSDAKPSADKKAGKFVVQVAALASEEKVTELQGKLTEAGFKSYVQKVPTDAGVRIRVRVGPFGSKDEAESARVKLGKLGFSGKLMPS